jgi:hypothetical protein
LGLAEARFALWGGRFRLGNLKRFNARRRYSLYSGASRPRAGLSDG